MHHRKLIPIKYLILILISILSISTSYSSNVKFYNINALYGISMREANSVCKDNDGFIWVSSKTGILRLTEDDYRIYQIPYETANIITVKLVCKNSILLAYTNNGQIFRYNEIGDRFELFVDLRGKLQNIFLSVSSVVIENTNSYWIASSMGLYRYKDEMATMIGNDNSSIHYAILDNNEQLFFAKGNEVLVLDIKTQQVNTIFKNSNIPSFAASKLFVDNVQNRLWIGSMSNGLLYYDLKTKKIASIEIKSFPKQPILAIESTSNESLLIGIDGQGVWEIDKNGTRVINIFKENADDPSSLRGNGIYDIFCEKDKRVWICTYSGGASYYEQTSPLVTQFTHQVNNPNSLANNDVNSIIEDSRGTLWFATNNGISCWEPSSNQWKSFYVNKQEQAQVFLALCEDDNGRIWAGTYSSGVYVLDERTGKELAHYSKQVEGSPFANEFVFDIYKDSFGNIWIGGINSEVICYNKNEDKFQKYAQQPLYSFAELSPDKMLLGCTYGLALLDKKTGETSIIRGEFLVLDIIVIDGIAWLATSGDGLIRFDTKDGDVDKYTTQNGLSSNFISSIAHVDGYLWLGTENGICRFNPKDKSVVVYSSIEPLSHVSFNRNAQYKLRNGQLAWGTNSGAILFNPKTIQQFQSKGKIFFQDLSISGRSIREHADLKLDTPLDSLDKIKLKYNQNTITLELVPIGVAAGSKFSWKMEGLDKEWSQPSSHGILTYTNIPSKHFVLNIRLYDNSLSQIIAERTLAINMTPPFWGTWWFLVICFIIVSGIIYLALWYYINLLKQQHTEEKVRFFTNTAHDIRTSLTLIKAPVEELTKEKHLSEQGHHYLNLATEQARRLSTVVTQLMDFQKVDIGKGQLTFAMCDVVKLAKNRIEMFESFANTEDIVLTFNSNQLEYFTAIDETMLEKVIDNLISNAIKYSRQNSDIQITLNGDDIKWTFEVKDQGIGISKKAQKQLFREFYRGENAINSKIVGSGIGLLLVKNYVALHGGQISYTSQENIGSTFQIAMPYKKINVEVLDSSTSNELGTLAFQSMDINDLNSEGEIVAKEMRILIVEDNDDLLNFMQYALMEEFEIYSAADGKKAWDIIQKQMPDLVVSDVMMPNMDGFELCQLMKSTYETSHIPIVLLTALSGKTEQLHGLGLGADDYLTKPFDMSLLMQKIKSIIRNRGAVREKALKLIKGNNTTTEPVLANELNDKFVKKMMDVAKANISNAEFDKDQFASEMNVSSSLLYKKLKSLTGQSPTDFIKTVRLEHALELIQSRNYNITEVSELCGFASVGYFSTVFKKHYGKSPTEIVE